MKAKIIHFLRRPAVAAARISVPFVIPSAVEGPLTFASVSDDLGRWRALAVIRGPSTPFHSAQDDNGRNRTLYTFLDLSRRGRDWQELKTAIQKIAAEQAWSSFHRALAEFDGGLRAFPFSRKVERSWEVQQEGWLSPV